DAQFSLSASYLEIYNEGVFDLLTPRAAGGEGLAGGRAVNAAKDLPLKWDAQQGFHVPGLKLVQCPQISKMIEV
ncbi:kinesin-like protein, partial [Haematococcus lacustris]